MPENNVGVPGDLSAALLPFWKKADLEVSSVLIAPLDGDGSARKFFRIRSKADSTDSFVVMWNPPVDKWAKRENLAYDLIGRHLRNRGVPVPEIHHVDHQSGCVVMEDLGDASLQSFFAETDKPLSVFERVLKVLLHLQLEGARGFDPGWCCQTPRYDRTVMILFEACYFRDAFLRGWAGIERNLDRLDNCFFHCAHMASMCREHLFLHRDFQSRNIMISGDDIRIIDWQGGRLGPPGYDLASLLIDPYTDMTERQRVHLLRVYQSMLRDTAPQTAEVFQRTYPYLALQRNMQILGAFAYLSRVRAKPGFQVYIKPALERLKNNLEELSDPRLLPLREMVRQIER